MKKVNLIDEPSMMNITYGCHPMHRLLNNDQNIGNKGENLTIMVLSCNRASSTIKLMDTIEKYLSDFEGTFLIVDNGSSNEQLEIIKEKIKKVSYNCDLVELEKNFGVSGGRNCGIKHVKTEWIMSLDNDIYITSNPLEKIKTTISLLGCHFLNLPLLNETEKRFFVNGGHLYLYNSNLDIHFGGGSLFKVTDFEKNTEFPPSLGTFVYGGASVFNKKTFELCGGFDENMFVGFEDYDFSIEVFQRGFKVGNLGYSSFVHDHKVPKAKDDIEYEKTRFSNTKLCESALYFEKKRGFKVWNDETEKWIREKHDSLNIND